MPTSLASPQSLHVSPFVWIESVADGSIHFAHKWIAGEIYGWAKLLMASFCTMAPSRVLHCILVFWQQWMKSQGTIETAGFSHSHNISQSSVFLFGLTGRFSVSCLQAETRVNGCSPEDVTWGRTYGSRMAAWCTNTKACESNSARLLYVQYVWDRGSSV